MVEPLKANGKKCPYKINSVVKRVTTYYDNKLDKDSLIY